MADGSVVASLSPPSGRQVFIPQLQRSRVATGELSSETGGVSWSFVGDLLVQWVVNISLVSI